MIILTLVLCLILNVLGQRYPDFFGRDNIENADFIHPTKNLKAYERNFQERMQNPRDLYDANPLHYIGGMYNRHSPDSNTVPKDLPKPNPGMGGYWGEEETGKKFPKIGPNTQILSAHQVMTKALRKLEDLAKIENQKNPIATLSESLNGVPQAPHVEGTTENIPYNILPKEDDFNAPIRWVPITSNDTSEGLAKVTDLSTGKNRQYIINGTILVPVTDYNPERIGLTTTVPPVLTTDLSALRTIVRTVDIKNVHETDWLVFEIALDTTEKDTECLGDGCQARCKKLACDSVCKGDTCASGCKGPGCFSMCIGTGCLAKCEGLSCEARCRGHDCEASCRSFSCNYVLNGRTGHGGGTWVEHYPQYDSFKMRLRDY